LPTEDIDEDTIYMVPKTGSTGDVYNEYLYVNNTWELIGSTEVDLTNYATKSYVDGAVFSGDYNDLTNKPTIPSAYTLPTATTSSLGGVKVDGETITIEDGVISAASGGGATYTAGNGINIDENNVISNNNSTINLLNAEMTTINTTSIHTKDELIELLKQEKIIYVNDVTWYGTQISSTELGLRNNRIKYEDSTSMSGLVSTSITSTITLYSEQYY